MPTSETTVIINVGKGNQNPGYWYTFIFINSPVMGKYDLVEIMHKSPFHHEIKIRNIVNCHVAMKHGVA